MINLGDFLSLFVTRLAKVIQVSFFVHLARQAVSIMTDIYPSKIGAMVAVCADKP